METGREAKEKTNRIGRAREKGENRGRDGGRRWPHGGERERASGDVRRVH